MIERGERAVSTDKFRETRRASASSPSPPSPKNSSADTSAPKRQVEADSCFEMSMSFDRNGRPTAITGSIDAKEGYAGKTTFRIPLSNGETMTIVDGVETDESGKERLVHRTTSPGMEQ
ncbi:MAG: hypothetical protein GY765_27275 [bacterium]|nr:hypothetical protein [bacterium]